MKQCKISTKNPSNLSVHTIKLIYKTQNDNDSASQDHQMLNQLPKVTQ